MEKKDIEPCPKCNNNRWKTKKKNEEWECRLCGHIKNNTKVV